MTYLILDSYDEDQISMLRNDGYLSPNGDTLKRAEMTQANGRTTKTRDFICWSFQVASGMEHLANKKVLPPYFLKCVVPCYIRIEK